MARKAKKNPFAACWKLRSELNSFSKETPFSAETVRRTLRRRKLIGRAAAAWRKIFNGKNQGSNGWSGAHEGLRSVGLETVLFLWWMSLQIEEPWKRHDKQFSRSLSNDMRSVHFLGAITPNGTLPLIKAEEPMQRPGLRQYSWASGVWQNQILSSLALKFVDEICPIHRAETVNQWKRDKGVGRVPWPAHSPDLKPIENTWTYVKRQLSPWPWCLRTRRKLLWMYNIPIIFCRICISRCFRNLNSAFKTRDIQQNDKRTKICSNC